MIATRIVEKNDENGGNTTKIADICCLQHNMDGASAHIEKYRILLLKYTLE
jgi:hypothetical protein